MNDRVTLIVDGSRFEGWTEISISRALTRAAASFSLSASERWPGLRGARRIKPGAEAQVLIGGDAVITGYVDEVTIAYDGERHEISVSGRSRTADVIDCAASDAQFLGLKLERIAAELAKPYGVTVRADVDTGPAIADFPVQQGETAFQAIERLAKTKALLVTDDEAGNLVLTRAGSGLTAARLKLGENLLSAEATVSLAERFSEYVVKGQRPPLDDTDDAESYTAPKGVVSDKEVPRFRRMVLTAEGAVDGIGALDRARWEAARRAGEGLKAVMTVQGWRQADGRLWRVNELAPVEDPELGLSGSLLIAGVEFSLSESGSRTRLTLQPREAFDLLPEPPSGAGFDLAQAIAQDRAGG